MNGLILKIIALISMTIDHSGLVLFNDTITFRFIGRMALPIYVFLLVEGFNHTKNDNKRLIKYYICILVIGILSEVLHDYVFYGGIFFLKQNIMFTLILALLCMTIYEKYSNDIFEKIISIMVVILIACLSEMLFVDYGLCGILLIFGFYLISRFNINKILTTFMYLILLCIYIVIYFKFNGYIAYTFGIFLSIIPISLYNGKKGYNSKIIKYGFYLYYPLHLAILLLLK